MHLVYQAVRTIESEFINAKRIKEKISICDEQIITQRKLSNTGSCRSSTQMFTKSGLLDLPKCSFVLFFWGNILSPFVSPSTCEGWIHQGLAPSPDCSSQPPCSHSLHMQPPFIQSPMFLTTFFQVERPIFLFHLDRNSICRNPGKQINLLSPEKARPISVLNTVLRFKRPLWAPFPHSWKSEQKEISIHLHQSFLCEWQRTSLVKYWFYRSKVWS